MAQSIKEEIIKMVQPLPDNVSMEDVMYHLYVKETIQKRLKEIDDGIVKPIPHHVIQERVRSWLK